MSSHDLQFLRDIWNANGEVYEVGGSVRDRFLGKPNKDADYLVCNLSIHTLAQILKDYGKVAQVGKSFGVLKFFPHSQSQIEMDFAIPRKEKSTGVGHKDFEVHFDPSLPVTVDLSRRDFTINAMAFNLKNQELVDPFGGKKDLDNKVLRQVFPKAFEEDPLRLVRAVQFAARFQLSIEKKTWESIQANASLIKTVSPERIVEELRKLFLATKPSHGFNLMRDSGLLKEILPEVSGLVGIQQDKRPGDDVYLHTMRVLDAARQDPYLDHPGDLELLLAALFHDTGKAETQSLDPIKNKVVFYGHQVVSARLARRWMKKMKITTLGVDPKNINVLVYNHMFETKSYFTDKAIRRFIQKIGKELIFKLLDLRLADNRGGKHPNGIQGVLKMRKRVEEELAKKPPFGPADLAISGNDLMAMGFEEGPNIGKILKDLVEIVLEKPEWNTENSLKEIVKEKVKNDPTLHQKKKRE